MAKTLKAKLLTMETQLGRLFNALLDNRVVWPETLATHHGGKPVGDQTRRVMNIHKLKQEPYGFIIMTVREETHASAGYALHPQHKQVWSALRQHERKHG